MIAAAVAALAAFMFCCLMATAPLAADAAPKSADALIAAASAPIPAAALAAAPAPFLVLA